jgi:fibronectin type 3 domain-containing protein
MTKALTIIKILLTLALLITLFVSCPYEPATYTLTFNANGASGTPPAPVSAKEYENIELPGKGDLSYDGKHFSGWNMSPNGNGRLYSPSYPIKLDSDTTLYAQWEVFLAPNNLNLAIDNSGWMIELTWEAVEGYENLEDWHNFYLYDGKTFVAYIIFRAYETISTYYGDSEYKPLAITSSPSYLDNRYDFEYGGDLEYFVTLGAVTVRIGNDFEISVGPHSNIVSTTMYGVGGERPAPTGVQAVVLSPEAVEISWNPVPRATGYFLYTSIDGQDFTREYGRITETWTIYNWLWPGSTSYYRVAAVNGLYQGGLQSEVVYVRTPGPPETVTGVTATPTSATSIDVSWNASYGASAYGVYYEIGSSTTKHLADTVVGTTYTHTGLTADTDYRYSIRAIDNETNFIFESPLFSTYASCKTPVSSTSPEPIMLFLVNNSSYPLRSIQINNGNNILPSNLYKNTSCQVQLNSGTYTVSVYDTQNKYMGFPITIGNNTLRHSITDTWPPFSITLRNNYSYAIAKAYSRKAYTIGWGTNIINSAITTNNTMQLGTFEQGPYEVLAESLGYYRVASGTSDTGITVSGGILDGYKPIWRIIPSFMLNEGTTVTAPATGWINVIPY